MSRAHLSILVVALAFVGCVDKEAEAKKKADAQKAFMEAEARARAEQEAAEAKKALEDATAGCDADKAEDCITLGRIHLEAKGAARDAAKAVEAFARGCRHKSKNACRLAAENEADGEKKLAHLSALCTLGDMDGCMNGAVLADELVQAGKRPEPKKASQREAMVLLGRACALGGARACTARGVALVDDDAAAALAAFDKGCDQGEPTSCWQLGLMLQEGKGTRKNKPDTKKAAAMLKKACDGGLAEACAKR